MATTTKKSGGGKGLAAEVTPSSDLSPIVGDKPIPRSEVTKRVWDYIKKNGLQDKVNKRMINADDKLLKIFNGKKQVSMFEMTALVSKHLKA
jgi:chromatin remodeling complex protein RSC6